MILFLTKALFMYFIYKTNFRLKVFAKFMYIKGIRNLSAIYLKTAPKPSKFNCEQNFNKSKIYYRAIPKIEIYVNRQRAKIFTELNEILKVGDYKNENKNLK